MTDSQFSKAIQQRDGGFCRVCQKPSHEVHHIVRREVLSVRWDEQNGISLCWKCHRKAHGKDREVMHRIKSVMEMLYGDDWQRNLEKKSGEIIKLPRDSF